MNVLIIGMGYIGLPTAVVLAQQGVWVKGYDIDEEKVDKINNGICTIEEKNLDTLLQKVVKEGKLKAVKKPQEADVFLIAVPTPIKRNNQPDLGPVENAIDSITAYIKKDSLLIIESTCPIGTTEQQYNRIIEKRPDMKEVLCMAYCPERVLPGNIVEELKSNPRIVGGINEESKEKARSFYKLFVEAEINITDTKTAEMCKLVENSYRDVCIAFANEISMVCDKAKIDPAKLIHYSNLHPRVNILQPGVGVGGHCIAVDPWFIISKFPDQTPLIRQARNTNTIKTKWVLEKILHQVDLFKKRKKRLPSIACMGLSFKANVDDLRGSPALSIAIELIKNKLQIYPIEPNIKTKNVIIDEKKLGLEGNDQYKLKLYTLSEVKDKIDIFVLLLPHKAFEKELKEEKIASNLLDFASFTIKDEITNHFYH